MLFEENGIRSFVGTPVQIGRQTYFVTFASSQTTGPEAFAEDDIAFVDVVAAFFAHRFTQQKQFERIQFQIEHDALTGLENRVQFRKAVRDDIAAGKPFTVAFINIDGFRHINEREGNQIGDEVLVEVASTLASVAPGDMVARMSADEFGVLIHGTPLAAYAEMFDSPFHTGDRDGLHMLGLGASIGAARYPYDGNTAEALMRRADVALDVAKTQGGSTTIVFDGKMEAIIAESHLRVVELSNAIAQDQLALVYQPTFDLATRRITGAEALVRWDHPLRGRLPPSEFITFAENNGLIAPLTRWVFRRTVRDVTSMESLPPAFRIYFNLAPQMLDDIPFIAELRAALDANPRLGRPHRHRSHGDGGDAKRRAFDEHDRSLSRVGPHRGDRRLRHRILVAVVPQAAHGRRDQDRSIVRHGSAGRRARSSHRRHAAAHHRSLRVRHPSRGHRDGRAARLAARARLPVWPRLSHRKAVFV